MRVAFVSMTTTRHRDTEGNRRLERLAHQLADRGHDVTVFCAAWWDDYRDERTIDGVTYHGVTVSPAATSFATRLPVLLARYRPDVIHVRPRPPRAVFTASSGGTLARAPVVLEWYGDEGLADSRTVRLLLREATAVVTPSEMVRTQVRERGVVDERSHEIPDGIDFSLIENTEPGEETEVAFGHSLNETANLDSLLLALAELRDRNWSVTVVGDGPLRRDYERQAADLRIDDRITFAGECSQEERIAIYRGAHAFVQTAYREYFARELLQALAAGCVGIVEYQAESSAHELIENHRRSFRVTDPQELADAIVESGDLERRTIDEDFARFDHREIVESYLDLYRDVQESHGIL
ncbi:glycosyltransferase family 4 protein [Halorhabdus rudnickae]|uniref:glycosyltransferase family 4 protein n=1 Tax=Halorhabdus rudnickae TaxID=1775544 RepID=UPI00108236E5|nr:glycosyltransferase family 4 protein [Halorhabdus rudnickae]